MKTIINGNFDPYYNLALEDYFLKKISLADDLFFLWRNKKCVIVGRNQNPFKEVDMEYATKNNIDIVRRSTGGGTVYHDEGNINFTFITSKIATRLHNYEYFLSPIITILQKLGIAARFVPKTHIYVGEHKVSGNAQTYYKDKMIHHGTLLFDVDTVHLKNVLKGKTKIDTHAIESEHSGVLNLKDVIGVELTITELMGFILEEIGITINSVISLTKEQHNEIVELANTKYRTWDWVYGQTPKFTISKNEYQFEIANCLFTKCSHSPKELLGVKYDKKIVSKVLELHEDKNEIMNALFT